MPQYKKSFFSLGGPTAISDPGEEERQGRDRINLQRQQLAQQQAAQQQAQVRAQQDAAFRMVMAQQNMGLDRERMAQQQKQFESTQGQLGAGRQHEALMAELTRGARAEAATTRFGRQQELAGTGREQRLEDLLAAEGREETRFGRRQGEEQQRFGRRQAAEEKQYQRRTEAQGKRAATREGAERRRHEESMLQRGLVAELAAGRDVERTERERIKSGAQEEALRQQLTQQQSAQQQSDRMALHGDLEKIRAAPDFETQQQMAHALLRSAEAHSPEMLQYVTLQLSLIQGGRETGLFDRMAEDIGIGPVKIGGYEPVDFPLVPGQQETDVLREALRSVR